MEDSSYPWYIPYSYRHPVKSTSPSKNQLNFSIEKILEPSYKCEDCKMTFKQRLRFDFHKCLFCRPCKKLFTRRNYLTEHNRVVHEGGTPKNERYICDYCGANSANKLSIERHMREKHIRMEKRYQCDLCPQSFNLKFRLSTHMIVHKSSIFCIFCQQYYSRAYFQRHVRDIHGTAHNYSCGVCCRRFKSKKMLRHHQLTHEKKFECKICGKKYAYQHHHDSHLARHQKKKNYRCALCLGKFSTLTQLKQHLQFHIGFNKNLLQINGKGVIALERERVVRVDDDVIVIDSD